MYDCDKCPRGLKDCEPLANIISDEEPRSFICVGFNEIDSRVERQDRFRHCWHNGFGIDIREDMDRRDIIDTIMVLSRGISFDENIRVYENLTDAQMNDKDLIAFMRDQD